MSELLFDNASLFERKKCAENTKKVVFEGQYTCTQIACQQKNNWFGPLYSPGLALSFPR